MAQAGCYCLLCERRDPPRFPSRPAVLRHLELSHRVEPEEGLHWLEGGLDEALRRRGQLTLDDLVIERFRIHLAAVGSADDFLLDCRPQGHS